MYDSAVTEITKQTEELSDTVMGASEATVMVRKATNSDPWGPSGTDMLKIANLSQRHTEGRQIMDALWLRLTNTGSGKNWRNVYKGLLLLEYLLKNGAERISGEVRTQIFDLKALTRFHYVDDEDVDRGLSVRERSKQIIELVHDTNRLKEERKIAHQNRSKYTESISSGGGGFGSGSAGHYASQSHFKSKEYDRERFADDDWGDDKGKRYNGPGSKSAAFSSDDDEFTVPKNVPKKEAWNPAFDDDDKPDGRRKPTAGKAPVFDDDDDWKDFDKVVITPKTNAAPAAVAPPAFAGVPQQQVQQKPAEVNPLDSLGVDLLGTGSLLTPDKPLPNLFGAPEANPTPGGLPNLFGAPEPVKPAGSQLPNIFGNTTPTQSTTNFGTGTFGTLGGAPPAGNTGGFGTTPGFGAVGATGAKPATGFGAAPVGYVAAPGYGYGVPVAGAGAPGYPAGYVYAAPTGTYPPGAYAYPAGYPATGY